MSSESTKTANIWYLIRYAKGYVGLIILTLSFLIASRIASSLDPIWLKKIIDGIGQGGTYQSLLPLIYFYFGLRIATFVFELLRDVAFAPAEMGISRSLSRDLFNHLLSLPVRYHHDQKIGGISRKITRGSRAVTFILDFLIINILPTMIELVVVTVLLFNLYQPAYAFITFTTIIAYTVFTVWATELRQKYRIGANKADDEVAGIEVDALGNIETVKYFNNEYELLGRYEPAIQNRYNLLVKSNQLFAVVAAGQAIILLIGMGLILVMAIEQTINKILTVGDLVLLTTYLVRLAGPIGTLGFVYRVIKDGLADLDGIAKILAEGITVTEPEHPEAIKDQRGEVVFDGVGFRYSENRQVLHDISFTVRPGQRVAFVGPSGVGKSTIVKLLFRFFDPTSGQIRIDGVDLQNLDKETRRSIFAIVPQEPALFNTTIGENIRFGKPEATQAEVEEAAKLASIDHFIDTLPDKYDTVVGERGVKLSGGEKQRVAIARSIIRGPKILVFDEATSSLDSRSEKAIQESLHSISKGRTTLAVAHRLSTIADSDVIYVLDKGTIAESGTHQELLAKKGLYAKLWDIQSEQKSSSEEED